MVPVYIYKFDFTNFDEAFNIFSKYLINHSKAAIKRFTEQFIENNVDNRRNFFRI